jgi:hypothetical protein
MPAKSKAARARQANAKHARGVLLKPSYVKPTHNEEVYPEDDTKGNLYMESLDDMAPEDVEEIAQAQMNGGLDQYTKWLDAAAKILASEAQAHKDKKRKHTYEGNSNTSKWRALKRKEKFAAEGFHGLKEFLEVKRGKVSSGLFPHNEWATLTFRQQANTGERTTNLLSESIQVDDEGSHYDPELDVIILDDLDDNVASDWPCNASTDASTLLTPPTNDWPSKSLSLPISQFIEISDESSKTDGVEGTLAAEYKHAHQGFENEMAEEKMVLWDDLTPQAQRQQLLSIRERANQLETSSDPSLDALRRLERQLHVTAPATLLHAKVLLRALLKNSRLDLIFRNRLAAMYATLNLYSDPKLKMGWRAASVVAVRGQGYSGKAQARCVCTWIHNFIQFERLPQHGYRGNPESILLDEDLAAGLKLFLLNRRQNGDWIRASDVNEYLATPEVQNAHGEIKISERTARRWLNRMEWRFKKTPKGMYIDGHERPDVVAYRTAFVRRWFRLYEPRMHHYDNNGELINHEVDETSSCVDDQIDSQELILVTHDESTFYAQDRRPDRWIAPGEKPEPQRKGEGASLMVSDFYTLKWGPLRDDDGG